MLSPIWNSFGCWNLMLLLPCKGLVAWSVDKRELSAVWFSGCGCGCWRAPGRCWWFAAGGGGGQESLNSWLGVFGRTGVENWLMLLRFTSSSAVAKLGSPLSGSKVELNASVLSPPLFGWPSRNETRLFVDVVAGRRPPLSKVWSRFWFCSDCSCSCVLRALISSAVKPNSMYQERMCVKTLVEPKMILWVTTSKKIAMATLITWPP